MIKIWVAFLSVLSFLVITIFITTIFPAGKPLTDKDINAVGYQGNSSTNVEFTVYYESTKNFSGRMQRKVRCIGSNIEYDIPDVTRVFKLGTYHVSHFIKVPDKIDVDTNCTINTTVYWYPLFSISEHSFNLKDVSFIVHPKPLQ